MAGHSEIPIVDHHCHLSPNGEGARAARRFRQQGGTHLFLCTQSYGAGPPTTLEGYREQFETTEQLAVQAREASGVAVRLVVAPFPIDLVKQSELLGLQEAVQLHRAALELAGRWVRERRAIALGEVGRPHFEVSDDLRTASAEVFEFALATARDVGCPAVVHSEDLDAAGYRGLAEQARAAGLAPTQVVKHYARSVLGLPDRSGLPASFVAKREAVEQALPQDGPYFLETDFLDDPTRPGAVLDLATIPRRVEALRQRRPETIERLRIPFQESVRSVYGFTPGLEDLRAP